LYSARAALGVALLLGASVAALSQTSSPRVPGFYAPFVPGLLARQVTEAPMRGEAGVEFEVWDLLVGPGITTDELMLPGAAVLQVRAGAAQLVVERQPLNLRLGQSLAIDEGQHLRIDNSGSSVPLSLRATLIRAP
jgi:hypothetical protein